jgi:uncharacterized membrane protein
VGVKASKRPKNATEKKKKSFYFSKTIIEKMLCIWFLLFTAALAFFGGLSNTPLALQTLLQKKPVLLTRVC